MESGATFIQGGCVQSDRVAIFAALAWGLGAGLFSDGKEVDAILARVRAPHDNDLQRMAELGDVAFPKVYAAVLVQTRTAKSNAGSDASAVRFRRMRYLISCATAKRTPQMTELLHRLDSNLQTWVFSWLADTGDPRASRALFEKALNDERTYSWANYAASGLARIADERALQCLITKLETKEDRDELQRLIAWKLGATMKPKALDAVRRAYRKGPTVPPLERRSRLPDDRLTADKEKFLSFSTDSAGVKWALIEWDALGAPNDLWVVHWSGKHWVDPVFTGVTTYWPHSQTGLPLEGDETHEKEMSALIGGKGWVKKFVANPTLTQDSDHDGLTDVVEAWIGLDPKNADSDGDGILDGVDKNPTARAHPMSEDDLAMQAVMNMECLSSFAPNRNHMIGLPEGVEPFEIESCTGPVYLQKPPARYPKATGKLFGHWFTIKPGVKHIGTGGNEVVVTVQESGGYYELVQEVRVKRIGGEWFCVSVRTISSMVS